MDIEVGSIFILIVCKRNTNIYINSQVSTPFDVKMLQYMITRCALLLRSYKTTLEQDQALLGQTTVIEGHGGTKIY